MRGGGACGGRGSGGGSTERGDGGGDQGWRLLQLIRMLSQVQCVRENLAAAAAGEGLQW